MEMSFPQTKQVEKQLRAHEHDSYIVDIGLAPGHVLKNFQVHKGVFRPDITCSIYLARWLFYNQDLYRNKQVIDVGCGTGIQGIVAAKCGSSVLCCDISDLAISNTTENIRGQNVKDKVSVRKKDLLGYEGVSGNNIIIFNHPFFPGNPIEEIPVSTSMLGGEDLIHKFLLQASFMHRKHTVIMPYLHLAGPENNPLIQGRKHGYQVEESFRINSVVGLQEGDFSIYRLTK